MPHFEKNNLVLLSLGDSNGGFTMKNRCHVDPILISSRPSTSSMLFVVCGGDERAVMVHAYMLYEYVPSLADVFGNNALASSAVGAGQVLIGV